jgi:hypothetical protein
MEAREHAHSALRRRGVRGRLFAVVVIATAVMCLFAGSAMAAQAWKIDALQNTSVAPEETFDYIVQIQNVGDASMDGTEIELIATLAPGLTAVDAQLFDPSAGFLSCTAGDGVSPVAGATTVRCASTSPIPTAALSGGLNWQQLLLTVRVDAGVSGTLTSTFAVSGGGAPSARTVGPIVVASDPPGFGVDSFDGQVVDAAGSPFTQAGGHPYAASVSIDLNTITNPAPIAGAVWPAEPVKDILVDLPPGLVGDPTAADTCTASQLANGSVTDTQPLCPPTSQVGTAEIRFNGYFVLASAAGPYAVYSMVPPPGVPARFGFNVLGSVVVMDAEVRSGGDYGLSVNARNIPEALPIAGTTVTFWGVPADPSHDAQRGCAGFSSPHLGGPSCPSGAPRVAFLRNPTSCPDPGVGLPTTVRTDSWMNPGDFKQASFISHLPPAFPTPPEDWGAPVGPTGCARVPFDPTFEAAPVTPRVGVPSGFVFDLSIPQTDDPDTIGQSDLRRAEVTLPLGVRVSPSSAAGLGACAPAQIGLDDANPPSCPDSSKIGSVTIDTPVLEEPLRGSVYLARQGDNPFGTLLSVYLVAEGPGVVVKLPGRVDPDPISGQLTATFDDNPQLPFSNLHLEFKGGPRAPLVTPKQCGTYTTHAVLTGWSGKVVASDSSFTLSHDGNGAPCPPSQFSPGFEAGAQDPIAGKSSPMHLSFSRDDEDEELKAVTVEMPNGLTGKIANVPLCPENDARAGACPEASRVGRVTVGAGAGPNPFYIETGRVYLTGPYKGAPFGLSIVVPAVAGPFDLGSVNVRSSIFVDKHTAELRVVSDALPTILQGIPLDVRDVRVSVDKSDFIVNPTSCAVKRINGSIESVAGTRAAVSSRFQVGECANLRFKPKMVLRIGSKGNTSKGKSVPFSTTLTMPRGNANLRSVSVSLPPTINARLGVINRACTRAQFEAGKCDGARAGTAVAKTPLLRDPLRGNAYFVRNGNPLPDLFITLRGQVDFDLIGKVTIPGSTRLKTTFDAIPDVPISSFTLKLVAGRQGPVGAAANLCSRRGRTAKAELEFEGQNGRERAVSQRLVIRGCTKKPSRGKGA